MKKKITYYWRQTRRLGPFDFRGPPEPSSHLQKIYKLVVVGHCMHGSYKSKFVTNILFIYIYNSINILHLCISYSHDILDYCTFQIDLAVMRHRALQNAEMSWRSWSISSGAKIVWQTHAKCRFFVACSATLTKI
jgi:hypothetical protein